MGNRVLKKAVNFGKDVPQYGPLDKLINAAMHPETSNEKLVALWCNALGDRELDIERLRQCIHDRDLIPVRKPLCDGKCRVTSKRIVRDRLQNIVLGRQDFGGFLVDVADTLLSEEASRLGTIFDIPQEPTADQAADYLEWVWSAVDQQNAFHVRNEVVKAWRIVAAESSVWHKIKAIRENGKMQLFCRQPGAYHGKWLPLPSNEPEPVWNDDPAKAACLRENDGIWLEAWISRKNDINVDKLIVDKLIVDNLIELLGISRLSDETRFKLQIDCSDNNRPMEEQTQRLRYITQAICSYRRDEEEDEPSIIELTLHSTESITRTFSIDDKEQSRDDLDATWDGNNSIG